MLAQLIKLEDYVSRYEHDILQYPGQFIRLKTRRWEALKRQWRKYQYSESEEEENFEEWLPERKKTIFSFFRKKEVHFQIPQNPLKPKPLYERAETIEELRQLFLDELFRFQLRWASSSKQYKSYMDRHYMKDSRLRFLLEQLPDQYLVFYNPVFIIKKAPIELDIIILSPVEVLCVRFIEGIEFSVFEGNSGRFWREVDSDYERKLLSPLISLNRTEKVIRSILKEEKTELFPIRKILVSERSFIDFSNAPTSLKMVDRRNFKEWHTQLINQPSPLKLQQLKVARAMLDYSKTVSVKKQGD